MRVAGQIWRDLQAHIAVATFGAFVYRPQNVGGVLNIAYGKNLVPRLGIEIGSRFQRVQQIGIIRAAGNSFFENGGIRGDASQPVFIHQALELTAGDQAAADVVQPNRLPELLKIEERIGSFRGLENAGGIHMCVSINARCEF